MFSKRLNRFFYRNPKISSAETSIISHRFAKVSSDGNLSRRIYLLTVDWLTPNLRAISVWESLLSVMASRNLF